MFALLEKQSLTPQELSENIKANPRFTEAFLEACVVLGLLDKEGDSFRNSSMGSAFLVPGKKEYFGDLVLHITNYWHTWGNLDSLIREGKTELPFHNKYTDPSTYWRDYMNGQHNRASAGQGSYLTQNVDINDRGKLLDLGGGVASYSIALCGANPQLKAFVVDRQECLDIARPLIEEHNLQDRITLIEGDFQSIDLGTDSDIVLVSGVVLIIPEEECRRLLRRAYEALVPGGLIIVQDFIRIDHNPQRNLLDTMMDLYVLIGFDPGAGDRHGDEYASWLSDTGFINIKQIPLPTQLAIITAEKRSST